MSEVVAGPGADIAELPVRLRARVAERLSSAHVPATIRIVPALGITATGKAGRQ